MFPFLSIPVLKILKESFLKKLEQDKMNTDQISSINIKYRHYLFDTGNCKRFYNEKYYKIICINV